MRHMQFRYNLDDKPPLSEIISTSIMWTIITISFVVILGNMITALYPYSPDEITWYLQKLLFITGIATIIQTLFGHRLPAVFGPSAILIVGATASADFVPEAFTTALLISALFGMLIPLTGIMSLITRIFTRRVIAAILMLIPITLIPSITAMLFNMAEPGTVTAKIIFITIFTLIIFYVNLKIKGFVKATLLLWALIGGSIAYLICFAGLGETAGTVTSTVQADTLSLFIEPVFIPGVIISILICYLALITNDIGSIQGITEIVEAKDAEKRLKNGIFLTGLINAISGAFGVIGGVNYSISTGMVLDTKNAARITLIPAGIIMMGAAFIPSLFFIFDSIPTLITGCLVIFLMTNQFSAAFNLFHTLYSDTTNAFQTGTLIGAGILVGVAITLMPPTVLVEIPMAIRPIFGNGFLIGVVVVVVMEHLIYRKPG
jgi:xanthine/uracil permease